MRLTLLERYIFKKTFMALLVALGALVGVVWIVRAVQQVDIVMTKGQGLWTYVQMISLGVPTLAAAIAPVALLIALLQVVKNLNNDSELVVMHAGGASRMSMLRPFMAAGLIVMTTVYTLHLFVGPASMRTLRTYVTEIRADLVSLAIREGAFRDAGKGLTFHVASRKPGGILSSVFILDTRSDKETFTYIAREGVITKQDEQTFLVLSDGQIQRLPKNSDNISVVKFASYAFNLSTFSGGKSRGAYSQMEIPTSELFTPNPEEPLYKNKPGRYRAELHLRLTGGLYPLATVLIIVAALGFPQSHRQGQSQTATLAALAIIGLRVAGVGFEDAARTSDTAVLMLWVIPLVGIILPSVYLLSGRSLKLSSKAALRLENANENIRALVKKYMPDWFLPSLMKRKNSDVDMADAQP